MEENITLIKITSENEAFETIQKALDDQLPENVQIEFEGWPVFKLSIYGDDFNGTIPTRIMPPIMELQSEIHRVYCRSKYGDESLRRLTDKERDHLELIIEVHEGCTEFITKLGDALNEAIKNSNMSGKEIATTLIFIGAFTTGTWGWKSWVDAQERMHNAEQTVQMSKEETKRLEIVTRALTDNPQAEAAAAGFNRVQSSFAKKLKPNDEIKLGGETIINGVQAEKIVKAAPAESASVRINGDFVISDISFPSEFGQPYKLNVKRITDGLKLNVEASHDVISNEQIETIKNAGFGIKVVSLEINAQKKKNTINKANLYSIAIAKK